MPLQVVFNDLSSGAIAPNQAKAAHILNEFAELVLDKRLGPSRAFFAPPYFPALQISSGFSVGRWLATYGANDREKRLRLKTLIDRRREYGDCVLADSDAPESEYLCGGRSAIGLSTALRAGGFALSLWTSEEWNSPTVTIDKSWIDGDDLRTSSESVPHACRVSHIGPHEQWLQRVCFPPPESGKELWDARANLLPNLTFTSNAEAQIKELGGNGPTLRLAVRGLMDLQAYCESWNGGGFDIHAIPRASGESESTLNMYSAERTFRCPDGANRLFDWHVKRNDVRIHFCPLPEQGGILIGYVGPHLRTSSHR